MKKKLISLFFLLSIFGSYVMAQSITPNTQTNPSATTQVLHIIPAAYDSGLQYNFIRIYTPSRPLGLGTEVMDTLRSLKEVKISTQYIDGLGRVFQTVEKNVSPTGHDLVTPIEYDSMGRVTYQYLPYVAMDSSGSLKKDPFNSQKVFGTSYYNSGNDPAGEKFFYGKSTYDAYPGGPIIKSIAPGNSWAGNARGKSTIYETNGDSEVRIWQIDTSVQVVPYSTRFYKKGQLRRTTSTDEQGHMTIEYRDKQGNIVMSKVQMTSTDKANYLNWLCTYYVYDEYNNLRFVIPPKATQYIAANNWNLNSDATLSNNLCFRYDYDSRGRMTIKKIPGSGKVEVVYDAWDRPVMSRDSNLAYQGKWLVTQYDAFSRPVKRYLWTNSQTRDAHAALATDTINYPVLSGTYVLLTQTFYDNYSWVSGSGIGLTPALNASETATGFLPPSSTVAPYPEPFVPNLSSSGNPDTVKGLITGTQTLILGTSNYIYKLNLYDKAGRIIQTQATNTGGGIDYLTNQYSFDNRVLVKKFHQAFVGLSPSSITMLTKYIYDDAGRLIETRKAQDSFPEISLSRNTYNELGQLQKKLLGQQLVGNNYSSNPIESSVYDYNIRGWLTGINKSFATGSTNTNYFGMQLSYDFGFNVPGSGYFNGNIAGVRWRSKGDGEQRAYGFTYDTANRLLRADFTQNNGGWNINAGIDFSTKLGDGANPISAYDANGNIQFMSQKGWKISGSSLIDSLSYTYNSNSNQLKNIIDGNNDPNTKLGDFRTSSLHPVQNKNSTTVDYNYDGNGNLIRDLNKDIDTSSANPVTYNLLNLPDTIRIKNKGRIIFRYDAAGNKLSKIVQETGFPDKKTQYFDDCVYQDGKLQFIGTEEGRVRLTKKYFVSGDSANKYYYDYFLRDNLGNTRMVVTEQQDTAGYFATMEGAYRAKEKALFYNVDSCSYAASSVPGGYPADNTTTPNDSVARVNGSIHPMGPGILLKVMSGDSLTIAVRAFFRSGGSTSNTQSAFSNILASLASGLVGMTGGSHGALGDLTNPGTSPVAGSITSFMNAFDTTASSTPKAYLNWMLLDNQFKYVASGGQSGAIAVSTPNQLLTLPTTFKLVKSGYVYIWVSNETKGWDVFFDNLSVKHYSGPMLEENHYYPYGLTMAGIADKALKPNYFENKYRYNKGSELQNKEFSDGSGLETYETDFRVLDPQLGRWWQIDPKIDQGYEHASPYSAMNNNPIRFNDPMGDESEPCCKELLGKAKLISDILLFMMTDGAKRSFTGKGTNFALGALNSIGSTTNGFINSRTFGGYSANPAQDYFGIQTQINPYASLLGQLAGTAPIGTGGASPDLNLAAAGADGVVPSGTTYTPVFPSSTLYAGEATTSKGKAGMELTGETQNNLRIEAPSGKTKYRVPDILNEIFIGEVKNVKELYLSSQIKDYMQFAKTNNLKFKLWIRGTAENPGTRLTPQLQKEVDTKNILLEFLNN